MSKTSFLDIQYSISKRKFLRKPSRMFSGGDRQLSGIPMFQPDINETKRVFDKFDRDKDGKISRGEYKAIVKALRQEGAERDIQKIFEVADLDGDGFIDFKEFVEVQKKGGGVKAVDVQSAFRTFDLDGDGRISVEEVYELMRRLGERCSLQDCRKMVRAVDANEDGVIDMDEFMTMMTQNMKI
ncbi:calmodulin-like protein 1 [Cynara cardunculus var. scolymus]|uniref:Calcium-binding EF-hand n=1 Tax=Cynara cardunculus var. scolymus TaxID=59895 RepID=A0A118JV88_CYNCS|nr:calmodulin-like protein 1 [Cynara cardunculus var. scolymus]KVH93279.1 Calcium-binding EF-hand [Cynara cardunculus var. scolymus]